MKRNRELRRDRGLKRDMDLVGAPTQLMVKTTSSHQMPRDRQSLQ